MLNFLLYLACLLVSIPVAVFSVQLLASVFARKKTVEIEPMNVKYIILIPAHNEEAVIAKTIESVQANLDADGRILVVADNCSDQTEQIANGLDVEVIIRNSDTDLGKAYALDFGIQAIQSQENVPDALIILDADCTIRDGSLAALARSAVSMNRPAQGLNLMHAPDQARTGQKISEFAWLIKNQVRAEGFRRLDLPCQLMGTGMAFPMKLLDKVSFRNSNIAEDLEIGIEFAIKGHPPKFIPVVEVSSEFPQSVSGETSQRKRWEHGHFTSIIKLAPKLLGHGLRQRKLDCLIMAGDLAVPPLSFLAMTLFALSILGVVSFVVTAKNGVLFFSLILMGIFLVSTSLGWFKYGTKVLTFKELVHIPLFILNKIPVYLSLIFNRQLKWVKTSRDSDD